LAIVWLLKNIKQNQFLFLAGRVKKLNIHSTLLVQRFFSFSIISVINPPVTCGNRNGTNS